MAKNKKREFRVPSKYTISLNMITVPLLEAGYLLVLQIKLISSHLEQGTKQMSTFSKWPAR